MSFLPVLLGYVAIALSLAAVFVYQWITLLPGIGLRVLYHVRTVQTAVASVALVLSLWAARRSHSRRGWRFPVVVLALTPASGALHAARLLVPLDDPVYLDAADATVDPETTVLGVEVDGQAHA